MIIADEDGMNTMAQVEAIRPWAVSALRSIVIIDGFLAVLAGGLLALLHTQPTVIAATWALALVIFVYWGAGTLWRSLAKKDNPQAQEDGNAQMSPAVATATSLAIQVQGVILGLIFAFNHQNSAAVKVGVVALGIGVIVGLLLYALSAISVSGPRTFAAVVILFNITLFSLAYGLLCIVAAFVA